MVVSVAPILVRATEVPPTTSAFYRMLVGGSVLWLFVLLRPSRPSLQRRVLPAVTLAGVFFAVDLFFWHRSIFYVGPGFATLLAGFQVFVLSVAGVLFLSEPFRWRLPAAIGLGLVGLALIVGPAWEDVSDDYGTGVLFGLITAVAYASVVLSLRRAATRIPARADPVFDIAWMSITCAGILFLVAVLNGESLAVPDTRQAVLLSAYAVTAQLGWVLIATGVGRVPTSLVGLILLLEPTFAYVWEILFFARPIGAWEAAGAGLALAGIYLGGRR